MNRLCRAALILLASTGYAQLGTIAPLLLFGTLDGCSVNGTKYNAGGSVRVNNFDIQVPKNLIVSFPTTFAPFSELCSAGGAGFEVNVVGNIIDGKAIAGQITIAQRTVLEASEGYIETINVDGTLKIKGGPTVRLNDPDGLFGPQFNGTQKAWVIDAESPSVSAFSGFPMCIPFSGNTAKCLLSNRQSGQAWRPNDPLRMVPLAVGDYIVYSGLMVGTNEILASEIVCNSLHLTTTAGATEPNYIRIEEFLIGVADTAPNVEIAPIRVVGYLSSCSGASVVINAIEVDPCTGKETYREIMSGSPKQEIRCRFDLRVTNPSLAPYTREYRITTNTPVVKTKDGIEAGQFVTPVTEWIFPEVDLPGTFPPPMPFSGIRGVVQGDFLNGKQYGQLDPFPAPNVPTPSKICSPSNVSPSSAPTDPNSNPSSNPTAAVEVVARAQRVGTDFALTGFNTNKNISESDLSFQWTQTSPSTPSAAISNSNAAKSTVTAPKVEAETEFKFKLEICTNGASNSTKCGSANTTVTISPSIPDTVSVDNYTWQGRQSGSIAVLCSSNVVNGDNKSMTLVFSDSTQIEMTQGLNPGKWLYSSRGVKQPTSVKCVSDLGGEGVRDGAAVNAFLHRSARN